MKPFGTCIFVALLSGALASPEALSKWENFKAKHGKQHPAHEEPERMKAFLERDAEIEAHNARYAAGEVSYSRKHNQYSDLTHEEFRKYALGYESLGNDSHVPVGQLEAMPSLPESFDWRQQGIMTSVKNQEYCGSCYAFASAGVLEAHLKWKRGITVDLSEQDVVDCSFKRFMGNRWNNGCVGGHPTAVYQYYNMKDAVTENEYPYTSGRTSNYGTCRINHKVNDLIQGRLRAVSVRVHNENDMRQYLVQKGPLVVALAADNEWKRFFEDLGDGVFDYAGSINARPNHVVALVGYGNHRGKDYWLIKNSWGRNWGVGGYGKIRRGVNMCGINSDGFWYLE